MSIVMWKDRIKGLPNKERGISLNRKKKGKSKTTRYQFQRKTKSIDKQIEIIGVIICI